MHVDNTSMDTVSAEGLRIGVKKGGCAGMEYTMENAAEIGEHDAIVEEGKARVMIATMATPRKVPATLTLPPVRIAPPMTGAAKDNISQSSPMVG